MSEKHEQTGGVEARVESRFTASADQEVWVTDRILAAMDMAIALERQRTVGANEFAVRFGRVGIAKGMAVEIIETLGGQPSFENLPNPRATGTVTQGKPNGSPARRI